MKYKLKFYGITDRGYVREVNEDNYLIEEGVEGKHFQGFKLLMAVADGMGGLKNGEVISSLAVKALENNFLPPDNLHVEFDEESIKKFMTLRTKEINKHIYGQFNYNRVQGGTTLTTLIIYEDKYVICHVGDSRVYLVRDNNIIQLTEDHSYVMEEVKKGKLTLEEARTHEKKNILTKAVGIYRDIEPSLYVGEIKIGDSFIVTSDGILNVVSDEELKEHVLRYEPKEACEILVRLANEREVDDNVTVNVLKICKKGWFR